MDSHTSVWPINLGLWTPTLRCGLSTWGHGLPGFSVAPQVAVMDSHASVWPLKLGSWTPTLRCDPSKLGSWTSTLRYGSSSNGLPRFSVASRLAVIDSRASVWPLKLVLRTPGLQCGLLTWGHGLPRFGATPQVGDIDSYASVWPLNLGSWTPMLRC